MILGFLQQLIDCHIPVPPSQIAFPALCNVTGNKSLSNTIGGLKCVSGCVMQPCVTGPEISPIGIMRKSQNLLKSYFVPLFIVSCFPCRCTYLPHTVSTYVYKSLIPGTSGTTKTEMSTASSTMFFQAFFHSYIRAMVNIIGFRTH